MENKTENINKENNTTFSTEKKGRIFIRNLPFSINEAKLKAVFNKIGPITDINIPKKDNGHIKGFGFIQYASKQEALEAIKDLNKTAIDGREIILSLAEQKDQYQTKIKLEGENKEQETKAKKHADSKDKKERSKSKDKDNKNKSKSKQDVKNSKDNTEEQEPKARSAPVNDPARTIFIRNLGYSTDESKLKEFFSKYGQVVSCKIVRDKETKASKGTGFVMFSNQEDAELLLDLFKKYDTELYQNKGKLEINPFELDSRNIKILPAVSKEDAQKITKQTLKDNEVDIRNKGLLFYGLSNLKEFNDTDISEEDKARRENLIKFKKTNFKKNTNLHVSNTRITIRNIDRGMDENKLKELIREKTEEYLNELTDQELKKKLLKEKKIKQIKILREKNDTDNEDQAKSKCVAFVEACDVNLAKAIILKLSSLKISKNIKKGLIAEFALDDIRKTHKRALKLEALKQKQLEKNKEMKEQDKNSKKDKKEKQNKKEDKNQTKKPQTDVPELNLNEKENASTPTKQAVKKSDKPTIETINNREQLVKLFNDTVSRGKKQRIKKKLDKLGYDTSNLSIKKRANEFNSEIKKGNIKNTNDQYITTKLEGDNFNINKQIKDDKKRNKSNQKEEKTKDKLLNKKRQRVKETPVNNEDDSDDMDDDMNPYYSQIMQNLNKNKQK